MIGLPCLTASHEDIDRLMKRVEGQPGTEFTLDLNAARLTGGELSIALAMPASARDAFLSGDWDATGLLLAELRRGERRAAARLPYPAFGRSGASGADARGRHKPRLQS